MTTATDCARLAEERARELFSAASKAEADALVASAFAAGYFAGVAFVAPPEPPAAILRRGWLAFYEERQEYGGPEEGGWHYTSGELVAALPVARWMAGGLAWRTPEASAADGYTGPAYHEEPLPACDPAAPAFWLDAVSHAAAVMALAAAVSHIGPRRARYGLAVTWSADFPVAGYPQTRPEYA